MVIRALVMTMVALVSVARGNPEPEAVRAQLQIVLDQMELAVLSGEPEAYLAHVWRDDPVFLKEQENWAADLKLHVPAEFELALGEDAPELGDGWAKAMVTMVWTMKEGRPRRVSYPARFVLVGQTWTYAGEHWEVIKGDRVEARSFPDRAAAAKIVTEVFPEVRSHVEDGFQVSPPGVQEVKVYSSMAHLQASIYLSYTDPLGGWNEPGESIKILASGRERASSLKVLLAHEFGHVCTFVMGDKAKDMVWWVAEGAAELASERFANSAKRTDATVRAWAMQNSLANWEDMADFRKTPDKLHGHVYTQGHHFVAYVSERFGRDARNAWLKAITEGKTLDEASQSAFKASFAAIDKEWRESLTAAKAEPSAR